MIFVDNYDSSPNSPFLKRFPWREKHLRTDWPSTLFPNGPFCNLYLPIADLFGGSRAFWLSSNLGASPFSTLTY